MGFCFSQSGKLCCDYCGNAGGVRKIKRPAGWCQAVASCAGCKPKAKVRDHSKCAVSQAAFAAEMAGRRWRVVQGSSVATILADDYGAARIRAAEVGFKNPESVVLIS